MERKWEGTEMGNSRLERIQPIEVENQGFKSDEEPKGALWSFLVNTLSLCASLKQTKHGEFSISE